MDRNHIIRPDDRHAVKFGFTSDRFDGWLWRDGDTIVLLLVISLQPREGNLKNMVEAILSLGLTVKIPTPMGHMRRYVRTHGFMPTIEENPNFGRAQVWVKTPADSQKS